MAKVWIVTGANGGMGQAIVAAAAAGGNVVVAAARRPESVRGLVSAYPGQVEGLRLDITDLSRIEEAVAEIVARYGRIDVVVNNAGRSHLGAVEETSDADLRALFEVHFFGPAALTRAVLPHLRAQKSGAIVQMSSMGGRLSSAGISAYSATKFALEGFSEALHAELAPPPMRLVLGADAVDAVRAHAEHALAELHAWGHLAKSTDLTDWPVTTKEKDHDLIHSAL